MEVWKDVKGYEGLYQVSSEGNIYSFATHRTLKPSPTDRYLFVVLCKNGKKKTHLVHRVVAEAFCKKRDGADEVNHINEIRTDNRAVNLEWCTRLENIRFGTGIQRRANAQRNGKRSKPIAQYLANGETLVKTFESLHEVHRSTGYDRAFVARCAKGLCPSAYGYVWRYVN